jgi:hypothetical protein
MTCNHSGYKEATVNIKNNKGQIIFSYLPFVILDKNLLISHQFLLQQHPCQEHHRYREINNQSRNVN